MKNKKHPAFKPKMAPTGKSLIHNTAGAEMPDPERRHSQSEQDVQEAFRAKAPDEDKKSKKNH